MAENRYHLGESVSDVLLILRHAAAGDFDGAVGDVPGNLRVLMGRGKGDSLAGMLVEICDWIKQAQTCERLSLAFDREEVIGRLEVVDLEQGPLGDLSDIGTAILGERPRCGWTAGACARLRDELIVLLGGEL